MTALRPELLAGRTIALVGDAPAVKSRLNALGARVDAETCESADAIVYDAAPAFGDGGRDGLREASAHGWTAIRDVATGALIPRERGGKVVVIAPRPDAGRFAPAARAALESLARTLSVEWARYGITATVITPGTDTTNEQIAELVCFLVSPGGDYFSGCRLSLGVTAPAG
jgi:NAD(P)-dependent dehydrogenase (short-subunit alcohol dehydrogenase family)